MTKSEQIEFLKFGIEIAKYLKRFEDVNKLKQKYNKIIKQQELNIAINKKFY